MDSANQQPTSLDPDDALLKGKKVDMLINNVHMILAASTLKLRTFKTKQKDCEITTFSKKSQEFHNTFQTETKTATDLPSEKVLTTFWSKLLGRKVHHNKDTTLLKVEEDFMGQFSEQKWVGITVAELKIQKIKN
eukprot:3824277-Ditylum_brightwellii.AAC.1